jgi:hypothetical protein
MGGDGIERGMTGIEDWDDDSGSLGRLVQCAESTMSWVGYRVTLVLAGLEGVFGEYTASIWEGGTP